MNRLKLYRAIVTWTSPLLYVLLWLALLTGLGAFKGAALRTATLNLLNPADAGKLHAVWLVLPLGLLALVHGVFGLQILVWRWLSGKRRVIGEALVYAVGVISLAQFLWLYLA